MKCPTCNQEIKIEIGNRVSVPGVASLGVVQLKVDHVVMVVFDDGSVPAMRRVDGVIKL